MEDEPKVDKTAKEEHTPSPALSITFPGAIANVKGGVICVKLENEDPLTKFMFCRVLGPATSIDGTPNSMFCKPLTKPNAMSTTWQNMGVDGASGSDLPMGNPPKHPLNRLVVYRTQDPQISNAVWEIETRIFQGKNATKTDCETV
jgi:hypothetical protein